MRTGASLLCARKASAALTPAGPLPMTINPGSVICAAYPVSYCGNHAVSRNGWDWPEDGINCPQSSAAWSVAFKAADAERKVLLLSFRRRLEALDVGLRISVVSRQSTGG